MDLISGVLMKTTVLVAAKLSPFLKLGVGSLAIFSTAAVAGLPIHDPFFDIVCFIFIGSIVGGEPEPDLKLPAREFFYLWFYRSSHLFISAATAYMIHKNKWQDISGDKTIAASEVSVTSTIREEEKSGNNSGTKG